MWYWIFRTIFRSILKIFFRFKVEGLEHLPQKSNFIIIANHASYMDSLIVMSAIPKKIHCIAVRWLYKIFLVRWFLNKIEALPSGGASERAMSLLMENKNVGLFPEGGISRDGALREFRKGAALLALKTGRPIVPCAILGAYEALPKKAKFPKFVPISLKIGRPIYLLREFTDVIDDLYLQEGIFKVKNTIQEMIYAGK